MELRSVLKYEPPEFFKWNEICNPSARNPGNQSTQSYHTQECEEYLATRHFATDPLPVVNCVAFKPFPFIGGGKGTLMMSI